MKIPFNTPALFPDSYKEIKRSLESGMHSGRGPYTKKCENLLEELHPSVSRILLSTSCTHALETAAILLNLSDDDEVIVPSYTFVTTALAFYIHGAKIRFCDIREDTLNIDEKSLESCINKKTKAIVVVHYGGVACEMDKIMDIARKNNIIVIEDNAHGLFGKYKGEKLGTIGDISTASFHETKNISCGEGGAIFINNNIFQERAEIIIEKGTNRAKFIHGQVDKYSWVDKGSSYIMSDILAALLYVQLQHMGEIQFKRKALWERYFLELESWANCNKAILPTVPEYCEQTYHMFYMIMPDQKSRNGLINTLKENQIISAFHYLPLDTSEMGKKIKLDDQVDCPNSRLISERIIRIPLNYDLSHNDQSKIIQIIESYNT